MEMRKCPECAEFNHFDSVVGLKRCWCCGTLTDYSQFQSTWQKVQPGLDSVINLLFWPFSSCARLGSIGKVALVVALPAAFIMLFICNSLDISVVRQPPVSGLNFGPWILRALRP